MKNKKWLKFLLKLLVSAGFASWIIYAVKWREVWQYLTKISFLGILIYLVVLLAGVCISSYKWRLLAKFKQINLPFKEFLKFYITGTFINNFMPSFLGGDTYRTYQIGKESKQYVAAASTVLVDRLTGYIGATLLAVFFGLLNYKVLWNNKILLYIDLGLLAFIASDFVILALKKVSFIRAFAKKLLPEKIVQIFVELGSYNNRSGIIWKATFYAVIFSVVGVALLNYILFLALGISINPLDYLTVIFITAVISALPISINNIGLKEWSYITFFGFFGIDASAVVTVAIVSRLLQMIVSFIALPLYLKNK